jgi:hypothetical protein
MSLKAANELNINERNSKSFHIMTLYSGYRHPVDILISFRQTVSAWVILSHLCQGFFARRFLYSWVRLSGLGNTVATAIPLFVG